MWDIDLTLLTAGGVAQEAYAEAFASMTGQLPSVLPSFAGRTDLDTAAEIFGRHGIEEPDFDEFFDRYSAAFHARRDLLTQRGRALPGAAEVLAALAVRPDIVQTVVTGNIRPVAEQKLAVLGLSGVLDLDVGGYGTDDGSRATLVRRSRQRAEAKYGRFAEVTVIGDTAHDIAGALACGVTAVGVATGSASAADLESAGAHLVLESLADVETVVGLLSGRGPARVGRGPLDRR